MEHDSIPDDPRGVYATTTRRVDLRPRVLYFIYQHGCAACAEAEPVFDAAIRKLPLVMALKLDANGPHVAGLPFKVRATPTWLFRLGDQAAVREGVITETEVLAWIAKVESDLALGGTP
jgi:hypothetical protein